MKPEWSAEDLVAAWTLVEDDWPLVGNKTGATRLGFTVLLKFFEPGPIYRVKIKSGYLRRRFTDRQIATVHWHLTRPDCGHPYGHLFLNTYGGQVNAVAPGATAVAHRDSILKLGYLVGWEDSREDNRHLTWIREFYQKVYADSGGVPAVGAFINYPDSDLADPRWNSSGTPWHELYCKDGYTKQQVKRRWDPRNVFHHALSVRR